MPNSKSKQITEKDFDKWKKVTSLKGKDGFNTVMKVRNSFEKARNYLRSSCYWDAYQLDTAGNWTSGGSWYDRWNKHDKMKLMWYQEQGSEDFESNIKAPMARGRINTFVQWMKKVNLEFGAKPNNDDDYNASIVADKTTNYWFNNSNARTVLGDAYDDLASHGFAYTRLFYAKEYKNYRFPKTDPKKLNKDEKKEIKEGARIIYDEPEKTTIVDDIVMEHVPIQELFPDPQGRNLHGDTYRCGWVVRRRFVTIDYLKAAFGDFPNVKNLDKVKGASAYKEAGDYFFEPPKDLQADDIVELLEMEDQDNDLYYVVANDIPIIGEKDSQPLPYNHKEVTYHKLDFIKVPGQFFGIGICDLLDNIQAAYEICLNMIADYVYRTYNYKLMVESRNIGQLKQALLRADDVFIPIDTSDGVPLTQKIMPLPNTPISFDIFTFIKVLEENATLATNIDPAQMAQLAGSKTATSDMLNKELLMTMLGGVIYNLVNDGLKTMGRQLWKLQQQYYTKPKVKEITGKDGKTEYKKQPRSIRLEGMTIELNDSEKILEEKETDKLYNYFEIKDEYLNTREEIDVYVKPESVEVESQSLAEQKSKEELAQLVPFAVDPNNPIQVSQHKMPMVNANNLFDRYVKTNRLPDDLLLSSKKNESISMKLAEEHMNSIIAGKKPDAKPGQSDAHLEYEYNVLNGLMVKLDELNEKLQADIQAQQARIQEAFKSAPVNPMTGQPYQVPQPQPNTALIQEIIKLQDIIKDVEEHISVESLPAALKNSRIMAARGKTQQEPMPAQPGMGGMPPKQPMGMPQQPTAPMPNGSQAPQINPNVMGGASPQAPMPRVM